ncbi:MAG: hypothetical protein JWN92_121 [Candidatus Acidoferrum typicum]|jgi:hypothetical protein|nr:hypothetical protein [Candidatus Acidoferrum typicum]
MSVYTLSITGVKIWVITEADRSSTCILLPEEYWAQEAKADVNAKDFHAPGSERRRIDTTSPYDLSDFVGLANLFLRQQTIQLGATDS